jgi:serine/threonine-protein kinase
MHAADQFAELQAALGHRFRLERTLGAGHNARVYAAEDRATGDRVALKVLRPELNASIEAERFIREMEWLQRLEHPRIGAIRSAGIASGQVYYVMRFVEGHTLRQQLDAGGPLGAERTTALAQDLLDVLGHAHARGVVHRDVEPANIMLGPDGATLLDFGLARAIEVSTGDRVTLTGVVVGPASYMSPEQCRGEDCDARADLYALGCVLYECLAGRPPFVHANPILLQALHLREPVTPLAALGVEAPAALAAVIERALAKEPAARWPHAAAMAAALG